MTSRILGFCANDSDTRVGRRPHRLRTAMWLASGVVALLGAATAFGASEIHGYLSSDGLTGRTATPAGWQEERIYLGEYDVGFGAGSGTLHTPPGWYSISGAREPGGFPGGTYGLFSLSFNGAPAFSLRDLTVPGGSAVLDNQRLTTPAHYSVRYNDQWTEWTTEPWMWGTDFYQTFVATQRHITRLATRLAGKSGDHYSMTLNFAIYQPNAGPPSTWTRISTIRSVYLAGTVDPIIHIFWVPFRSNEMDLIPGQTYAARFWRASGSQADSFAIVARPDINNGYAQGQLYNGNTATNWDAYAYISGGENDTVCNYAPVDNLAVGDLLGWNTRFGQTFQATGTSLAAVEIAYATGDGNPPSLEINFQAFRSVNGIPLGPSKKCYGLPGHYEGRAAAVWRPGEVSLTPGEMYYIEWTSPGCNTWRMQDSQVGDAYVARQVRAGADMMMSIVEYSPSGPIIALSTEQINAAVLQGDNAAPTSFTVRNAGAGTLDYTITDNADWLSVDPPSGSSTGESDTINVTFSTASLAVGYHPATITVAAAGAVNTPKTITVNLVVSPRPTIACTTSQLTTSGVAGKNPPFQSFGVRNSGTGVINYSIEADVNWISVDPTSGSSTGETDNVTVTYNTASLSPGVHHGTVTITSAEAVNSPYAISVTLTLYARTDFDQDGDTDLADFGFFQTCFSGPNQPYPFVGCDTADLDADTDVDLADFAGFLACFNGPNRPSACQ